MDLLVEILTQLNIFYTPELVADLLKTSPEVIVKLIETLEKIDPTPEPLSPEAVQILAQIQDKVKRFYTALDLLRVTNPDQIPAMAASMEASGLLKAVQRIDELAKSISPNYAERASKQLGLLYPVSIRGVKNLIGTIPFHFSLKSFFADKTTKEEVLALLEGYDLSPPSLKDFTIEADIITSEHTQETHHVLMLVGLPIRIFHAYTATDGFGIQYPTFKAHITVDKVLWDEVKEKNLTPTDLEMEIGALELRHGDKILWTQGEELKKSEPLIKGNVLKIPLSTGLDAKVYRNPSNVQAAEIHRKSIHGATRYFGHENGDLYMWDAYALTHSDVMSHLGVEHTSDNYAGAGTVHDHGDALDVASRFRSAGSKASKLKKSLIGAKERLLALKKSLQLQKAVKPSDWNKLHEAANQEYSSIVDHKFHMGGLHSNIQEFLNHPDQHAAAHSQGFDMDSKDGIGAKARYNIPTEKGSDTVQFKPYHKIPEKGTETHSGTPIAGWATMATKALFHSAGIGHMVEDVHVAEHQGLPVTATKFTPGYSTISNRQGMVGESKATRPKYDPVQVQQVQMMDWLTANTDRHRQNLMVSDQPNKSGHNSLLAIDNDRGFQYHQNIKTTVREPAEPGKILHDQPKYQKTFRALGSISSAMPNHNAGNEPTRQWWLKSRDAIHDTFTAHSKAIKDPSIARHVVANFTERFNSVNQWANNPEIHENHGFFSPKHKIKALHHEIVPRIGLSLPKDEKTGIINPGQQDVTKTKRIKHAKP
jgi:hypothetical protein